MNIIEIGNLINFFGVMGLLLGHFVISILNDEQVKKGFFISGVGATLVAIGSFILESYPVVILDIIWALISFSACFDKNIFKYFYLNKKTSMAILSNLLLLGLILLLFLETNYAAYITTFIYVFSYLLFSKNIISKFEYLTVTFVGFILLIPHLLVYSSYSVLINEIIGAIISLIYIIKNYRSVFYS